MGVAPRRSEVHFRQVRLDVVRRSRRDAVAQILAVRQIPDALLGHRDPQVLRARRSLREWCAWDASAAGRLGTARRAEVLLECEGYSFRGQTLAGGRKSACRVEYRQRPRPDCRCLALELVWQRWAPCIPGGVLFAALPRAERAGPQWARGYEYGLACEAPVLGPNRPKPQFQVQE